MTPAQLQTIAELHAAANNPEAGSPSHAGKDEAEGTVGDLMAFASMTRR